MEIKEMRQALRDAGVHMPRANADVMPAYYEMIKKTETNETVEGPTVPKVDEIENSAHVEAIDLPDNVVKIASTNLYTYIGSGDEPPYMINFMGMQKFVRGQATEVTNPDVIKRISKHRCFVKGSIDLDTMFKNDETEREVADEKRKIDAVIQSKIERKYKG